MTQKIKIGKALDNNTNTSICVGTGVLINKYNTIKYAVMTV